MVRLRLTFVFVLVSAVPWVGDPLPAGDLSILGLYSSGDYGRNLASQVQSTRLRYVAGDRFQVRITADYLRVESPALVLQPGLGPIPSGPSPGSGPKGSGGSGGSGNGSGAGGSGAGVGAGSSAGTVGGGTSSALESEASSSSPDESASRSGPGDIWIGGFVRLFGGGAKVFRLDTGLEAKVPVADEADLLGTGEWDYRVVLSSEYQFWSALAFGTLGWSYLGDPDWIDLQNAFDLILGAETDPLGDRIVLSAWLEGSQEVVPGAGSRSAVGVGLRSTGRVRWRLLATLGLSDAAEDFSVGLGVSLGSEPPKTGTRGIGL